jgi:hypothetical protein
MASSVARVRGLAEHRERRGSEVAPVAITMQSCTHDVRNIRM